MKPSNVVLWGALVAGGAPSAYAQDPALTLKSAIAIANDSFADSRASRAERSASEEALSLEKRAYLPEADLYVQWNRATRNNTFGLVFPSPGLPGISGPVLEDASSEGAFGSVVAALFHWEAYDFGVRAANLREAEALRRRADAGVRATALEVSLGTVDSFLGFAAADSAQRAASAAVSRMEVFTDTVEALAESELRPGADLSLARSELARARTELIRAEEIREQARASLAEWLGRAGEHVEVDAAELLETSPGSEAPPAEGAHPIAAIGEAERDAARARRDMAASAFRPKLNVLGAVYGRGTGAAIDGSFEGGSEGLWPERTNWAVGLELRFPLLDFATRQQTKVRDYLEQAAEARYDRALGRVTTELLQARIHLDSARRIVENTRQELEAGRALQLQARARYDSGLAALLEVAEAERILRRSETEDAVARIDVWRARFQLAAAEGDLTPLLAQLR